MPKISFGKLGIILAYFVLICATIIVSFLVVFEIYSTKEAFLVAKKVSKTNAVLSIFDSYGRMGKSLKEVEFSNDDLKVLEKK